MVSFNLVTLYEGLPTNVAMSGGLFDSLSFLSISVIVEL
jgi:hypothetical protein